MERICFETAKLVFSKNFNYIPDYYYDKYGHLINIDVLPLTLKNRNDFYAAAFQEELKEWLRKEHDTIVIVYPKMYRNGINWLVQVLIVDLSSTCTWSDKSSGLYGDNGEFNSYEEALEFGLQEALKRI